MAIALLPNQPDRLNATQREHFEHNPPSVIVVLGAIALLVMIGAIVIALAKPGGR